MSLFSRVVRAVGVALCVAILTLSSTSVAQSPASFAYTVSLSNPERHLAEVQIILPRGPRSANFSFRCGMRFIKFAISLST